MCAGEKTVTGRGQREAVYGQDVNVTACHVSEKRSKVSRKNGVYYPGSLCPIDVTSNRWLEYSLPVFTSVWLAGVSHLTAESWQEGSTITRVDVGWKKCVGLPARPPRQRGSRAGCQVWPTVPTHGQAAGWISCSACPAEQQIWQAAPGKARHLRVCRHEYRSLDGRNSN